MTESGSVKLTGQRLTIRLIDERYLKLQKCSRYRYEVVTQESPFLGFVDFVYSSDPLLRAGHTYDIRFNADTDNPWIEEVFGEVHPTPV
jgi:hypothetical protein